MPPPPDLSAFRGELFDLLLENAREYGIFMTDLDGVVVLWNAGAEALLGWSEDEAVGQHGSIIFTEEERAAGVPEAELAEAARTGQAEDQRWHQRKDGSRFWANGMMIALRDETDGAPGDLRGFAKILRDDTRTKAFQEELAALNRTLEARVEERTSQVRALSAALAEAEADERRRVADLLHDDLQQRLYAIRLVVDQFVRDLDATAGEPPTDLADRARQMREWTDQTLALTRRLAAGLVVPSAPEDDLTGALQTLGQEVEALHGLHVDLRLAPEADVPDVGARTLVLRTIRELLFNVVKHAGVDHASIRTGRMDEAVEIWVEDGGRGFDLGATPERSLGLPTARHHLALLGGAIEVATAPGQGCRVRLTVPHGQAARSAE